MASVNVLGTAVSGLMLNSARAARAADNIANATTVGFKRGSVQASSLALGGVQGVSRQNVGVQGLLRATSSSTDLGISGNGLFAVSSSPSGEPRYYTRAGSFRPNADGFLVNTAGQYLLGHPTNAGGVADESRLEAVNVHRASGTATASQRLQVGANLPSTASVGDAFTVSASVTDSLGNDLAVPVTFTRAATNVYTLTIGDVTAPDGTLQPPAREGTAAGPAYQVNVHFSADGTVAGFDLDQDGTIDAANAPSFVVPSPTTGAADLSVALDFGESRGVSALTQFGGTFVMGAVASDGATYGNFESVGVSSDGTVMSSFSNGEVRPIYRLPVATFPNPDGLEARSGNVFIATDASGAPVFRTGGAQPAGTVQGGSLEESNVDIASEFIDLIMAETAYRASATVVRTAEALSRTLLDIRG